MSRPAVLAIAALLLNTSLPALAKLPGRPAVIVQDFRNRSYDVKYDWVGTGLAYLIRKNLSGVDLLDMLEDRRAKPGDAEPLTDYVIEGEIRLDEAEGRSDGKFVVFVTLEKVLDATSRRQFLTEGTSSQLFEMGSYLSERILRHLGVETTDEVRRRFGRGMTSNLAAFRLFAEAIVERRIHAKVENYDKAVLLDPTFAEAYFHLARVHTVLRDHGKATAALRKTLELVPGFAPAENDLAYVLAQQGKIVEAEAQYRAAIASDPTDPRYHLNLGDLLRHQGKSDAARASYHEALKQRPGDPEATAALNLLDGRPAAAPTQVAVAAMTPPPLPPEPKLRPETGTVGRVAPSPAPSLAPSPRRTTTPPPSRPSPVATPSPATPTPGPMPIASPAEPARPSPQRPVPEASRPAPTPRPSPAVSPPVAAVVASGEMGAAESAELESARGLVRGLRGDHAAANAQLAAAERAFEKGQPAVFLLEIGRLYLSQRMAHASVGVLRRGLALDPESRDLRQALADAYDKAGKRKDAERLRAGGTD